MEIFSHFRGFVTWFMCHVECHAMSDSDVIEFIYIDIIAKNNKLFYVSSRINPWQTEIPENSQFNSNQFRFSNFRIGIMIAFNRKIKRRRAFKRGDYSVWSENIPSLKPFLDKNCSQAKLDLEVQLHVRIFLSSNFQIDFLSSWGP
jgi:hypothetical protein